MAEMLDTFSEQGIKQGTLSKKEYYSLAGDVPWIKCCTCFVIDTKEKKILFEKRGNTELDSGKLDLCSGHVQSEELPRIAMVRELGEELGIAPEVSSNIYSLGEMNFDYTQLSDVTNRKNMKCIVSMYALKLDDINQINIDNDEVVRFGWLDFQDARGFIENSMTRIPYEPSMKEKFDIVFDKLQKYIDNVRETSGQEEQK